MFFGFAKNEISLIIVCVIIIVYLGFKYGQPFLKSKRMGRDNLTQSQIKNSVSQPVIESNSNETGESDVRTSTNELHQPLTQNLEKYKKLLG